jgi:uncharacterized membrane protein
MVMDKKLKTIVTAAVFAALVCAATMLIQIPTLTKGYVNLGDCVVLIAGWVCGAPWGFAAAGIGSALADIISGYAVYAPATFLIKGLMAVIAAAIIYAFGNRAFIGRLVSAVAAELFMALGYFAFEWIFITGSFESSVIGIPENLIQGAVGVLASAAVMTALERTKALNLLKLK